MLAQLSSLPLGSPERGRLTQSILDRAPSSERLAEVRALARYLGPYRTQARGLALAQLALLDSSTSEARALRASLVIEKHNHDVALDALEHDKERAEDMRAWTLMMQELYE